MIVPEEPIPPIEVEGYVYDEETDDPLSGVLVSVDSDDADSYTTDDSGYYNLAVLPGSQTIIAFKKGYEDYSVDIEVNLLKSLDPFINSI